MYRRWFRRALAVMAVVGAVALLGSCGAPRRLVSITVSPATFNIFGAGLIVHFTAMGNFENPVETRDITNLVVWSSAAPQIVSIDPNTGVAVSGLGCGSNITIAATFFANHPAQTGASVVGTAGVSVTQPPPSTCQ